MNQRRLIRGDLVRVRSANEILATLDEHGAVHGLPFMHEMLHSLGRVYRVHRRVEHFSFDGDETCGDETSVRAFPDDDVVVLEESSCSAAVRCSGAEHGQCKRGCTVFWRQAWLEPVNETESGDLLPSEPLPSDEAPSAVEALAARLRTRRDSDPELYYCQSSELLVATRPLGWSERLSRCAKNVTTGNYGAVEMLRNVLVWITVRGREKFLGAFPVGKLAKTPTETLNLQPGELVEVKSRAEIVQTLDREGLNRGLHFAPEQLPYCGRRLRVAARADHLIAEGLGNMRSMKNTVILEDAVCDSATWAFGACPRRDYIYWREIWLKRVNEGRTEV